jgi:hypothetical protein
MTTGSPSVAAARWFASFNVTARLEEMSMSALASGSKAERRRASALSIARTVMASSIATGQPRRRASMARAVARGSLKRQTLSRWEYGRKACPNRDRLHGLYG